MFCFFKAKQIFHFLLYFSQWVVQNDLQTSRTILIALRKLAW